MSNINCADCGFGIRIGGGVKRSLIRHFTAFLHGLIVERGFQSTDPALFNQDTIEAEAWRLAESTIDSVERYFYEAIDGSIALGDELHSAPQMLREALPEILEEVEAEFRANELYGIDMVIQSASGTPIAIAGTPHEIDPGEGPPAGP